MPDNTLGSMRHRWGGRLAIALQWGAEMSLPRRIIPGRFYMVTRRCTQRQFLLRPDDATNNAFLYILADAAARFGIDVILPSVLSNHHHTVIYDRHGRVSEFAEHLHKLMAKSQNVLRGREENLWASEEPSILELVDYQDVLDKLVYAAINPVKAHLVQHVHQWPGVNGLSALLNKRTLRMTRPRHYFSADGIMPEELTLDLVIPPELGDAERVRGELRARVEEAEQRLAAERARSGTRVLGRRAVLAQSWHDFPTGASRRGGLNPRIAARETSARIEALRQRHDFLVAYREAWRRWRAGLQAIFPIGTYWLRRFANVPIAQPAAA